MRKINLCLNYHDFSGTPAGKGAKSDYTLGIEVFKSQLDFLRNFSNRGILDLIALDYADEFSYTLSFDDGNKSNLFVAEELAKRGLKGVFFIITSLCKTPGYLNEKEIKELDSMGMEIGSHSCTHRHLNRLRKEEMITELQDSKIFLEDIVKKEINLLAFPGGQHGTRELIAAKEIGYQVSRIVQVGINNIPLNNSVIKGINIKISTEIDDLRRMFELSNIYFSYQHIKDLAFRLPKYFHSKYMVSH
jgi:peptidoglycan/xylan/chitin deacetylase (PgdA/CDA1 family)